MRKALVIKTRNIRNLIRTTYLSSQKKKRKKNERHDERKLSRNLISPFFPSLWHADASINYFRYIRFFIRRLLPLVKSPRVFLCYSIAVRHGLQQRFDENGHSHVAWIPKLVSAQDALYIRLSRKRKGTGAGDIPGPESVSFAERPEWVSSLYFLTNFKRKRAHMQIRIILA